MYIHDDADMATIVATTAKAILEGARHVGNANITREQMGQLEMAIKELQRKLIDLKKT